MVCPVVSRPVKYNTTVWKFDKREFYGILQIGPPLWRDCIEGDLRGDVPVTFGPLAKDPETPETSRA